MRANISEELMDLIEEKIYLDMEVHMYNNRILKAEKENKNQYRDYLEQILKAILIKRVEVSKQLRDNGIKIFEAEKWHDGVDDEMFVQHKYYQKVNGGFKEGIFRMWRAGIKLKLKKRMNGYFSNRPDDDPRIRK